MTAISSSSGTGKFWLLKSEPEEFSIDHLAISPNQIAPWTGVRNYQSRNLLRDQVSEGDRVFFYHSSTRLTGIAGVCFVARGAYPDPTSLDPRDPYFDPKASVEKPIWCAVDISLERKFASVIPLSLLKQTSGLEDMMLCRRGSRLSIQPVTLGEWKTILKLDEQLNPV